MEPQFNWRLITKKWPISQESKIEIGRKKKKKKKTRKRRGVKIVRNHLAKKMMKRALSRK